MAVKVAINGFGRIGRLVARAMLESGNAELELVAINDLADAKSNAWLFSRDSVHGRYPGEVAAEGQDLVVDGKRIRVTAERDPGSCRTASSASSWCWNAPASSPTARARRSTSMRAPRRC
jgi:glyceraldehyde 3-phosphate dehydrogenase